MNTRTLALSLCLVAATPMLPSALAQAAVQLNDPNAIGTRVTLQFPAGDQLTGRLVSVENGIITIRHNTLGELSIESARISRAVRPVVIDGQEKAPANPDAAAPPPEPEPEAAPPAPEPDVKWTREFEAGIRGSAGNTDRLNFDTALLLQREDDEGIFTFHTSYYYAQDDGEDTANRFDANLRNEWKLDDPRWTLFAQGAFLYDEFQDYDYRVSGGAGVGYKVIDEDETYLQFRVGVGASREFGDMADDTVIPEVILAADFRHNLAENSRILASTEIFPSLDDFGEFRSISSAAWELDVDKDNGLSFRIGAEHRYESQVQDAEETDLDYFARLVYSF